jgi:hypothetical protein
VLELTEQAPMFVPPAIHRLLVLVVNNDLLTISEVAVPTGASRPLERTYITYLMYSLTMPTDPLIKEDELGQPRDDRVSITSSDNATGIFDVHVAAPYAQAEQMYVTAVRKRARGGSPTMPAGYEVFLFQEALHRFVAAESTIDLTGQGPRQRVSTSSPPNVPAPINLSLSDVDVSSSASHERH